VWRRGVEEECGGGVWEALKNRERQQEAKAEKVTEGKAKPEEGVR
jgi:hypothetical protein